jgi:hypothetical protein
MNTGTPFSHLQADKSQFIPQVRMLSDSYIRLIPYTSPRIPTVLSQSFIQYNVSNNPLKADHHQAKLLQSIEKSQFLGVG